MSRVEVRQLHFRGEPAKAGLVEFAVADALRTEVVDDGRLVLVRRFALGQIGLGDRGASRAAAGAWRTIRENARHGGASGADGANCVWFRDLAEARALLMRELASGRTPSAWFWALAVPDWRRATLVQWLDRRLDDAARDATGETAAALVAEALAAGSVEALAGVIAARIPPVSARRHVVASPEDPAAEENASSERPSQPGARAAPDASAEEAALAIARSIPAPLRQVLAQVAARPEVAAFAETVARGLALRAHPALSLAPMRLAAVAAAVARVLRVGEGPVHAAPDPARPAPVAAAEPSPGAALPPRPPANDDEPAVVPGAVPAGGGEASPAPSLPPAPAIPPRERLSAELHSAGAGVFLAIVPLIRLGWRDWLVARPHLALHQPGPRLLRRIAAHYRVPTTDAVWAQLPVVDPADAPPEELAATLDLWRAGLDGWLRRKARLRLADLVRRAGWILPGGETTLVRFRLEAIEIGLRRLALDADPGWVDWLGQSYRVVYRDRPLIGADPA